MATVPTGFVAEQDGLRDPWLGEIASRVSASNFSSGLLGQRSEGEGYATGAQLTSKRHGRGTSDLAAAVQTVTKSEVEDPPDGTKHRNKDINF